MKIRLTRLLDYLPSCAVTCVWSGLVVLICMSYLGWLLLDRRPTVEVTNVKINPPIITPGDTYEFSFMARPLRDGGCSGEVDAYEVDSAGGLFLYEQNRALNPKPEGNRSYSRPVTSHLHLAPGPARYGRHIKKWCNLMQKLFWPMTETRETGFMVR